MDQDEQITKQIERLERARELCRVIETVIPIDSVTAGGTVVIRCGDSIDTLRTTRAALRNVLGTWEDRRDVVWESSGRMLVAYAGTDEPIELWMSFPLDAVPDYIVGDCEIVEQRETRHVLVCKKAPG